MNNKANVDEEEKKEEKKQDKLEDIKLLFLDVDGVLNTYNTISDDSVDRHIIERLANIIRETKCNIVLSSAWRTDKVSKKYLFKKMREWTSIKIYNDINEESNVYMGDTKDLDPDYSKNENGVRSEEIMDFLWTVKEMYNVTHWVAVDDMKLGRNSKAKSIPGFNEHFCQTDPDHGITDDKMKELIVKLI